MLLAPLRFGAGLKGKVVDAWAHGLPVCTTPVGAEGMFGEPDDAQVHVSALACYIRLFEAQAPRFHQLNRVLLGSEREAVVIMPEQLFTSTLALSAPNSLHLMGAPSGEGCTLKKHAWGSII